LHEAVFETAESEALVFNALLVDIVILPFMVGEMQTFKLFMISE